jgi:LysM repeat protein
MNLDERIEDGLRQRPSDERVYSGQLTALAKPRRIRTANPDGTSRSSVRRSAVPALAGFCAVLALAAGVLLIGAIGPRRGADIGNSPPESGSPQTSGTPRGGSPAASTAANSPATVVTANPRPSSTYLVYVVKNGDSLSVIAQRFNVSLWEMRLANPQVVDINHIEVGQSLNIPPPGLLTQPPASPSRR